MLVYFGDVGEGGSRAAPDPHFGQGCFFAFELCFDGTIVTVAHPSAQTQAFCLGMSAIAKADALHSAANHHVQPPGFSSFR